MLYNKYEDYMKNVLGRSYSPDNTYEQFDSDSDYYNYNQNNNLNNNYNSRNNYPNYMNYNDYDDYNNCSSCNNFNNYNGFNNYNYSYPTNQYHNQYHNQYQNRNSRNTTSNIEQMYPDIYKLINPMVCEMCDKNNQPITEELIEQMTNNIYDNVVNRIEIQNVINVNIETREASASVSKDYKDKNSKIKENEKSVENRSPQPDSRPRRNRLLQDLIRILILNELLRRNRPPFRPGPMPMPPRPWF